MPIYVIGYSYAHVLFTACACLLAERLHVSSTVYSAFLLHCEPLMLIPLLQQQQLDHHHLQNPRWQKSDITEIC